MSKIMKSITITKKGTTGKKSITITKKPPTPRKTRGTKYA